MDANKRIASFQELPMRVGAGQFMDPTPERLRFLKQLGVDDILLNMHHGPHIATEDRPLTGEPEWSLDELLQLRHRVEDAGLRLNAIENVPTHFYDEIMLGTEGRHEQLDHLKTTIRNIGRAGIPFFSYHWMPSGVWRTSTTHVRGGAEDTAFQLDAADPSLTHHRAYSEAELWDNYERFVREIIPVAEEVDLKIGLHPNDPPVQKLGGIPQLFRDFDSFERAMNILPSDNHGLTFCLGCWAEMGADLSRSEY